MAMAKLSVDNAPRDKAGLIEKGRFHIRELAKELGVLETEESKNAFMALTTDDMAKEVLKVLQAVDQQGGRAVPEPAAPKQRTPRNEGQDVPAATNGAGGDVGKVLHNQKALAEKLDGLSADVTTVKSLLQVSLSLNLMLAEQVLSGANRNAVLTSAVEDAGDILKQVTEIVQGKGRKK